MRQDPLTAVLAGKKEIGQQLAGKGTLNRMELTPSGAAAKQRYSKISYSAEAIAEWLVRLFQEVHARAPRSIVLDLDAADVPLHGEQEQRFCHGYYNHHCYLPLSIVCGRGCDRPTSTVARAAWRGASAGGAASAAGDPPVRDGG